MLDINDETVDGQPEIRLWGLDQENRRVLIIDRGLLPYFYLLLDEGADPERVLRGVEENRSAMEAIEAVEAVERSFFGRLVKAIKVTCRDPDLTTKCALSLAKLKGVKDHLEDDIRYSTRYLINTGANPCGWHKAEVEEIPTPTGVHVDRTYLAKPSPRPVERDETPALRVLSFSMTPYSPRGSPKPDRDPIVIISTRTSRGEKRQFVAEEQDDRRVIEAFIRHVHEFDPDIIAGYGTDSRDWPYLTERAKKMGIKTLVDRSSTEPHTSLYGHVSITGRANVDLYELADEIPEVKIKTLENIADYLGVMRLEERTAVEEMDVPGLWKDAEKRQILLSHSMEKAESIHGIAEALLPFAMELAHLTGLPLDHVGAAAVGFRSEAYMIRQAYRLGELIPQRVERRYYPYQGAIVLKPKPGLHEQVAVLDFSAMYPNIMITFNISPDTYLEPDEPEPKGGVYVAPEVSYRFRREPPGFYRRVLSNLIAARKEVRAKLEKLDPKSPEHRVLDARQRAIKVTTNAAYGYAGWIGARWYSRPVAEATTAWGRHTIRRTIDLAKKARLEVIYGDTDSVFVRHEPEKVEGFLRAVEGDLGLEIRPDKVYERALFTEAKKRYAGLLPDGRLDIVGLEVARGDWADVAKNVQEGALGILLRERSPERAVEFVRQYVRDLRGGKIPYRDLIIWKTLTKPPEEYKVNTPHVAAAMRLMGAGWELTLGDKVGYVITRGAGRLYERAVPYPLAKYDDLDLQYYEENQVVPAASRVLSIFKVTEDELKPRTPIEDYVG